MGNSSVIFYAKWGLPVARIERTGVGYASLKDALDAAETNDKITLLAEINPTTENPAGGRLAVINKAVTLDLNGQVITAKGSGTVIAIDGAAVAIIDSVPDQAHAASPVTYTDPITNATVTVNGGVITGGSNSGVRIENGGSLSMIAGTIAGNTATNRGGGVYVDDEGSFSMSGTASVSGNTAGLDGGGVFIIGDGTFNMEGGKISGNSAPRSGGGVYLYHYSTFNMSGGEISSNTAGFDGGGVYVTGDEAVFTMSGGKISGNNAQTGGGVYIRDGSLNISGSPEVSGNTRGSGTGAPANNVYLRTGKIITISGGLTVPRTVTGSFVE